MKQFNFIAISYCRPTKIKMFVVFINKLNNKIVNGMELKMILFIKVQQL